MSQKSVNGSCWQTPPGSRNQIILIPTSLEERIPDNHPVRLLDEILSGLNWTAWGNTYNRKLGQPPIHPRVLCSVPCSVLLFAMIRRIRSSRSIEYEIARSVDFLLRHTSFPAARSGGRPIGMAMVLHGVQFEEVDELAGRTARRPMQNGNHEI